MRYFAFLLPFFLLSCAQAGFKKNGSELNGFFRIKNADTLSIYVSTDGYEEHKAVRDGGIWRVSFPYAERFTAYMTADGKFFLPACPMKEYDDFGSQLCVYEEQ